MKTPFYCFLFILGSIIAKSQTNNENIIPSNYDFYGNIDRNTTIKVIFDNVILEKKDPETYRLSGKSDVEGNESNFEGRIIFNSKKTKKQKDAAVKVYDYEFLEQGTGKHNGTFSGEMIMKKISERPAQISFNGNWENYEKNLKFPVYFDNIEK